MRYELTDMISNSQWYGTVWVIYRRVNGVWHMHTNPEMIICMAYVSGQHHIINQLTAFPQCTDIDSVKVIYRYTCINGVSLWISYHSYFIACPSCKRCFCVKFIYVGYRVNHCENSWAVKYIRIVERGLQMRYASQYYSDVPWAPWRLKALAIRLFAHYLAKTSNDDGALYFWPFVRGIYRWILLTEGKWWRRVSMS